MVNASRAEDVENRLIMLARSGQLRQRVSEDQLKEILAAVAEQQKESVKEKVVVQRRGAAWDDDDLDDLLNED
jgi:programmed cell death protein 5